MLWVDYPARWQWNFVWDLIKPAYWHPELHHFKVCIIMILAIPFFLHKCVYQSQLIEDFIFPTHYFYMYVVHCFSKQNIGRNIILVDKIEAGIYHVSHSIWYAPLDGWLTNQKVLDSYHNIHGKFHLLHFTRAWLDVHHIKQSCQPPELDVSWGKVQQTSSFVVWLQ